ncbi:ABC transporter ATP-binding protein [Calditrichota bacterium]
MTMNNNNSLIKVNNLKKLFPVRKGLFGKISGYVRAVDDVSFEIESGKTLGLVGESGCGKTTTGKTVMRLLEPTEGKIIFDGRDVTTLKGEELREIRQEMQIVFQDPYSSLNPRITVGGMIKEILLFHKLAVKSELDDKVESILDSVGLSSDYSARYPHEFSGGQRQRIGIARALSVDPSFIVLDEPVSALDVSIQAQILNLLMDIQQKRALTYLFIAHDVSVVEHIADDIAVMYLGRIVEVGKKEQIINNPQHPYTKALLEAVPMPDPDLKKEAELLTGDVPSPINPPSGCHFHTRCPLAKEQCSSWRYKFTEIEKRHQVACVQYE